MPPRQSTTLKPSEAPRQSIQLKSNSAKNIDRRRRSGSSELSAAPQPRAASSTSMNKDDAEVYEHVFALEILLRKLKQSQPSYLDEDVVNPHAELNTSSSGASAVELQLQHQLAGALSGHPRTDDSHVEKRGSPNQRNGGDFGAIGSTNGKEVKNIMEVAELLDVAQLGRSRRCLMDLLKLLQRVIAFTLSTSGASHAASVRPGAAASASSGLSPHTSTRHSGEIVTVISPPRKGSASLQHSGSDAPHPTTSAPSFTLSPLRRRCVALLDEVIQSVLVHANESEPLRSAVRYDRELVAGMCAVCLLARQLELRTTASSEKADFHSPSISTGKASRNSGSDNGRRLRAARPVEPLRDVAEIRDLQDWLQKQHVGAALSKSIADVFALEMLLDSALPPAVCSSRFDGMTALIWECKASLIGEVLSARGFLNAWMKKATPFHMLRMAIMGLYAPTRSRAKLYDKMVSEGLLNSLEERIQTAVSSCKEWQPSTEEPCHQVELNMIHDCLDVLLCITAPATSVDDAAAAAQAASSPPQSRDNERDVNEEGGTLLALDAPQPRGSSKGATTLGANRGVSWSTHIGSLRRIAKDLASITNIAAVVPCNYRRAPTSALPSRQSSSHSSLKSLDEEKSMDSFSRTNLSRQNSIHKHMATSATSHNVEHSQQRAPSLTRPMWFTTTLADKICECLFQIARGSPYLLHMMIADVLDPLFDSMSCHAAAMLLPLVLNVVDAIHKSGATSTTSAEDSSRIDMIADWFSTALSVDFVPWLFEHRRQQWTLGRIISSLGSSLTSSSSSSSSKAVACSDQLPVVGHVGITRHLRRDEEPIVVRFLEFGKRLVRDTAWREGTTGFLQKVLVIAKSIWTQQAQRPIHRRTMIAGLAVECIHIISPLVNPLQREPSLLQTLLRTADTRAPHAQKRERSEDPPMLPPPRSPPPQSRTTTLLATPVSGHQDVLLPSPAAQPTINGASPQSPAPRALLSEFEGSSHQSEDETVSPQSTTGRGSRRVTAVD